MEMERPILSNGAISMTFDEVYMEPSIGFLKALQELKNLRTQLHSASEYCEITYLQNEQKQMVVENIKDYAVRALVNAVDHLGTVAYKLTELIDQQSIDVSNVELKVSCLNQQLMTCHTCKDKEGLRQQQLSGVIQIDLRQHNHESRSPTVHATSKTLSWHLASEAKPPTLKGATGKARTRRVNENENVPTKAAGVFHLVDNCESSAAAQLHQLRALRRPLGAPYKDPFEISNKQWTGFDKGEGVGITVRSKSVLSAFFVKQKTPKVRLGSVM